MSDASRPGWLTRLAESAIAWCLVLSFALHVAGGLAWVSLRHLALFRPDSLPKWLRQTVLPESDPSLARKPDDPAKEPPEPKPEDAMDPNLVFVEVDPAAVTGEIPEQKTPFYSTADTVAANVKPPDKITTQPKIEGTQEKMVRTFDNDRPRPFAPAQPLPQKESEPQVPTAAAPAISQPLGGVPVGEMAFAKPVPLAKVPKPQPAIRPEAEPRTTENRAQPVPETPRKPARPTSLAEARANRGMLVGETMRQDGGVSRLSIVPSLDVRASPFGNYDAAMIYIIQQAWYRLLDDSHFTYERSGRVVLRFKLRADGSIADMKTLESEVGDTLAFLCETAVIKPQPYAKWPSEMRREVGGDTRELTFTFHYH